MEKTVSVLGARAPLVKGLAYLVPLLLISLLLPQAGLPIIVIAPLALGIAGLTWLLDPARAGRRLLGSRPPRRRATAIVAAVSILGVFVVTLLLPDGADESWYVVLVPAFWMSASFVLFALVSLIPGDEYRHVWVTVAGLVFIVLGVPSVAVVGAAAFAGTDVVSEGSMVQVFVVSLGLLAGVPSYLRLDAALAELT